MSKTLLSVSPLRVVVDSQLKTPADAKVLSAKGNTLVVTACDGLLPFSPSMAGAEVVCLAGEGGQVDLVALLKTLAEKECNQVLIEAGSELAGSFLQAGTGR